MAENDKQVDFDEDRMFSMGWGLIFRVVCAPDHWDAQRVSDTASREDPPGTSLNRWEVTDVEDDDHVHKEAFPTNPIQCPDCATRRHWLINC